MCVCARGWRRSPPIARWAEPREGERAAPCASIRLGHRPRGRVCVSGWHGVGGEGRGGAARGRDGGGPLALGQRLPAASVAAGAHSSERVSRGGGAWVLAPTLPPPARSLHQRTRFPLCAHRRNTHTLLSHRSYVAPPPDTHAPPLASTRTVGRDTAYLPRSSLIAGRYEIAAVGASAARARGSAVVTFVERARSMPAKEAAAVKEVSVWRRGWQDDKGKQGRVAARRRRGTFFRAETRGGSTSTNPPSPLPQFMAACCPATDLPCATVTAPPPSTLADAAVGVEPDLCAAPGVVCAR